MDSTPLTDDLGYLLSRASGLMVRGANAALAAEGLRVRQYSVLALAADTPEGTSQRELASVLGLDPSQVVLLVDDLAAAGLVERRPSPTDRRTRLVVATDAGRVARARAAERADEDNRRRLRALSAEERETLRALLARVVATGDEG
ncbi:MarR family winged helix-turn-helix transcriptional regulator [Blastococcus sp. SYSU D00820]